MDLAITIPWLLFAAWLLPLASFTAIVLFGPRMGKHGVKAGYVATGAILASFLLSLAALGLWLSDESHWQSLGVPQHAHAAGGHDHAASAAGHDAQGDEAESHGPPHFAGDWPGYTLAQFGSLRITIGYYIDSLTIAMFCMVTLIATCIHFYAQGYMHDELHDVTDHEVTLADGQHLHRPGRYHRFFQYLSLFSFSMLGVVISGNMLMTFVFWELVGICSYFLIGFYIERKTASNAANKAFIVNRVGDFGMIIGMMALWGSLGTFSFADYTIENSDGKLETHPGIFSQVRSPENDYRLETPTGMVLASAGDQVADVMRDHSGESASGRSEVEARVADWRNGTGYVIDQSGQTVENQTHYGYWLLIVAGVGIFCGCVGKSAQFPLHVWLPDAMEGPTPVSALVHSATMVAAGVFLVGRFYPVFTPEVLLVIATVGGITLFLAASIALVAVDIKRVLAYSTVSQLGYMMLALGVGGWFAGMFHLFTHAFFKSLLFLCSGSVIHAVHTNDMTEMGGLRKKMPITAYTMLVGCLAIIGAGIPFLIGFSGFHSKDAIVAQTLNFAIENSNPLATVFYYAAAGGAVMTAFYMFRLWYMTFTGKPRNQQRYDHAHESPRVMTMPLVVLAVFAIGIGWSFGGPSLNSLLEQARPAGTLGEVVVEGSHYGEQRGKLLTSWVHPDEHKAHDPEEAAYFEANVVAFTAALVGFLLATIIYAWRKVDPVEIRNQFGAIYRFLWNKWWFDELYQAIFVQPAFWLAALAAWFDKHVLDWIIDNLARWTVIFAKIDDLFDRLVVDALVNLLANCTWSFAASLRTIQTGKLRQYVVLIVIGTVSLFVLVTFFLGYTVAAP